MIGRAVAGWGVLLCLAIANGAVREGLLTPRWGPGVGHVVSTLALCVLIALATWWLLPWLRIASARQAWGTGALWLALTLAFEFLAGHYVGGKPWPVLWVDYDVSAGRLWPLVLVMTAVAPWAVWRLRA